MSFNKTICSSNKHSSFAKVEGLSLGSNKDYGFVQKGATFLQFIWQPALRMNRSWLQQYFLRHCVSHQVIPGSRTPIRAYSRTWAYVHYGEYTKQLSNTFAIGVHAWKSLLDTVDVSYFTEFGEHKLSEVPQKIFGGSGLTAIHVVWVDVGKLVVPFRVIGILLSLKITSSQRDSRLIQ